MTTAIIGAGNIGSAVAQHLADGGEDVVLAASDQATAAAVAQRIGARASAATVPDAITAADTVVFAVWLDVIKELIEAHGDQLDGKVVIDPSNPIAPDGNGGFVRTLPDRVSSGSVIAAMLPPGAHYAKAFGTIAAEALASSDHHTPERVVLFYATDDPQAATVTERLITAAGFDPVKVGGVDQSIRIEVFGDLHQFGGLDNKLLDRAEALQAAGAPAAATPAG